MKQRVVSVGLFCVLLAASTFVAPAQAEGAVTAAGMVDAEERWPNSWDDCEAPAHVALTYADAGAGTLTVDLSEGAALCVTAGYTLTVSGACSGGYQTAIACAFNKPDAGTSAVEILNAGLGGADVRDFQLDLAANGAFGLSFTITYPPDGWELEGPTTMVSASGTLDRSDFGVPCPPTTTATGASVDCEGHHADADCTAANQLHCQWHANGPGYGTGGQARAPLGPLGGALDRVDELPGAAMDEVNEQAGGARDAAQDHAQGGVGVFECAGWDGWALESTHVGQIAVGKTATGDIVAEVALSAGNGPYPGFECATLVPMAFGPSECSEDAGQVYCYQEIDNGGPAPDIHSLRLYRDGSAVIRDHNEGMELYQTYRGTVMGL